MHYCPFRHFLWLGIATKPAFVRLACLIHTANVRSEPESNPSKVIRFEAVLRLPVIRTSFRNRLHRKWLDDREGGDCIGLTLVSGHSQVTTQMK